MLFNCGAGEDSWESLWEQGDQTSQSYRKSTLNTLLKDWCWSRSSNTLATWFKDPLIGKDPDAAKDWGQKEKRQQRMRWLDSIIDSMDVNLGQSWEMVRDTKPGVLQAMGLRRVGCDLATEQQQQKYNINHEFIRILPIPDPTPQNSF